MNIQIDLIQGKRVLHIVLEGDEVVKFDQLLNTALNTKLQEPWLELEARIDRFIRGEE